MSYNIALEDKIDHHFIDREDLLKKKQMGGVGWLVQGNMCCGIYEDLLVVRVDPSIVDSLLKRPCIHLFSHREGVENTFLSVTEELYERPKAREKFLTHSYKYTSTLPAKQPQANAGLNS